MKFSIIVPSFNQDKFIEQTFQNLQQLKKAAASNDIKVETLLFDNCSNNSVQEIIEKYKYLFDFIEIKKDKGQYDAINKGIAMANGNYWTWLNTDDKIDIDGFLKIASILNKQNDIDYIYGGVKIINENNKLVKEVKTISLTINRLVNNVPGIYQPGSFFKKLFTDKIGQLQSYQCCFDYEYVLRILLNKGKLYACDFTVSEFILHGASKTGSTIPTFVREQLEISKQYGRKTFSFLALIAYLRLLKHRIL